LNPRPECRAWLAAEWREAGAEAAGELLKIPKSSDGTTMTATAVAAAMRIRTAPPFIERAWAPLDRLGVRKAAAVVERSR
jgi:hypothetical protein